MFLKPASSFSLCLKKGPHTLGVNTLYCNRVHAQAKRWFCKSELTPTPTTVATRRHMVIPTTGKEEARKAVGYWLSLHDISVCSCVYVSAQCGVSEIIAPSSPHGGHFSFTLHWTCNCKPDRETKGRGNCAPAERAKCKENKAKRKGMFELMAEEWGGGEATQVCATSNRKNRIYGHECVKVQV